MSKLFTEAELFAQSLLEASQEYAAGRESWFPDWPSRAQAEGIDVVAGLRSLACRMQYVIDNGLGDDLAKAIATAEQARCLRVVESEVTSLLQHEYGLLDTLIDSAEASALDVEACEQLHARRIAIPLPEEARLNVVAVPLSSMELSLGLRSERSTPTRLSPAVVPDDVPMALLDGGHPTARLISRFEARIGEMKLDGGETLLVETQLDQWWGVRVLLDGAAASLAEGVRIGPLALEQHESDVGLWQGSLGNLDLATRLRLLAVDICIRLSGDRRFLL